MCEAILSSRPASVSEQHPSQLVVHTVLKQSLPDTAVHRHVDVVILRFIPFVIGDV